MKNVLFAASECTPFIKTGGLADVIGSLPQSLQQDKHCQVRVILPLYDEISAEWTDLLTFQTEFQVKVGWRSQTAALYTLDHAGITYYFVGNEYYFTRKGIYGYYDDGERFVFFSKAVVEVLPYLDFKPDILHAHDWQTGLAVAFAKILNPDADLSTVFTIHNIKYQGIMPHDAFNDLIQLPLEHFGGFEWNGMINCMKSGIFHADKITTVSPSYAEEIKDPYYGEALHGLLTERSADLSGVINGIDTEEFNPMKDPHLPITYSHSRTKKKDNKELLQKELGLTVNREIPLYIAISRLVEQKGFHLLERIMGEFLQQDVQVVILGTGDPAFEHSFSHTATHFNDKMAVLLKFDEGTARKLYAASDFFIMPSQFEPCGLSQLIALRYKSVPIVRETGGLKDTVQPFNELTGEGNGFSFTNYNAHDLLAVMNYSLRVFHNAELWKQLIKNVNKSLFSWKESALAYADIYKAAKGEASMEE